jgi:2-methylcitrate dehydratase PrpD
VIADDFRPDAMIADLGARWEIARNYFKRHACCRYNHAALDAMARIVAQQGGRIDPDRIARIDVDTYVWAAQLSGQEPHNMLAAKFSLPYSIATFVVNGGATVDAFRAPAREDRATRDLARRVFVSEDARLTAMLPASRPARVTVRLADGAVLRAETATNRGDTEDPYPPEEIAAKFLEIAGPVWGADRARAVLNACATIDRAGDVRALNAMLEQ